MRKTVGRLLTDAVSCWQGETYELRTFLDGVIWVAIWYMDVQCNIVLSSRGGNEDDEETKES